MEMEIRKKSIQKLGICLTHEDMIRFEQEKAEAGKHDPHYAEMTLSEYIEIVLHHLVETAEPIDENL